MLNQERCSITKLLVVIFVLLQLCAVLYYAGIYGKINANFPRFQFSMLVSRYEPIQSKSRVHDHVLEELMKNPIYSKFGIKPAKSRKRVTLLIIVSTGPRRHDRRQAIRQTWWQECKPTKMVIPECIFMTDHQNPGDKFYNITKYEASTYKDMHFQNLTGGIQFGKRFLYHMIYALTHYEFDYFLRADDDYFFCLNNFLQELPVPMVHNFHWGWVHCNIDITRPEESMILLSQDIILRFLQQDYKSMMCHPWADQMIGVWSTYMNMTYLFRHDGRLHHTPIVKDEPQLRQTENICHHYMGIHGAYPKDVRILWEHRGPTRSVTGNLIANSNICVIQRTFQWSYFTEVWKYEPRLCVDDPVWDTSKQFVLHGSYSGRQDVDKQK